MATLMGDRFFMTEKILRLTTDLMMTVLRKKLNGSEHTAEDMVLV